MKSQQQSNPVVSSSLLQEAFIWRARLGDDAITDADRKTFHDWLRIDVRHELAFDQADRFWESTNRLRSSITSEKLAELRAPSPAPVATSQTTFALIARAAIVAMLAILGLAYLGTPAPLGEPPQMVLLQTEKGAISTFDLEDGSFITLGAASEARVTFSEDARRVVLVRGDAYFDVASDVHRPFTVSAGLLQVSVTGTAFDIRRSGAIAEVAVADGTVKVFHNLAKGSSAAGTNERSGATLLSKGYRIEFSTPKGLSDAKPTRSDRIGAWREDRLVFEDAPISEIVADLNRYLVSPLIVADEKLGVMTFSATVGARDLESFIATLTEVFPMQLERRRDGTRVLRHSEK